MAGSTHQAKQEAQKWLQSSQFLPSVEAMLNDLCRATPADPAGFCSDYMLERARAPTVTRIKASSVWGPTGRPVVTVDVHALVRNKDRLVGSFVAPSGPINVVMNGTEPAIHPTGKTQPVPIADTATDKFERKGVACVVEKINTVLAAKLAGLEAANQQAIDEALWAADDSERKKELGGNTITAVSWAAALAGAEVTGVPLSKRVSEQAGTAVSSPVPLVTALSLAPGKLKARAVLIHPPVGGDTAQGLETVATVLQQLGAALAKKNPMAVVGGPDAGFRLSCDKLEAALDLVAEAVAASGLTLGEHVFVGLDIGGSDNFDAGKGKYELVAGAGKDINGYIADLVKIVEERGLSVLVDPLHGEHVEAQRELAKSLAGKKCDVIYGDMFESNPESIAAIDLSDLKARVSCVQVRLHESGTLTRLARVAAALQQAGIPVAFAESSDYTTAQPLFADVAAGLGARFYRGGGLQRERTPAYNRLASLRD